jgi:predicted nicotinamide N-methyase
MQHNSVPNGQLPFDPLFETEQKILEFGAHRIELCTVRNLDALFDALLAKGAEHEDVRDERVPYWADLWPSALAMGNYMLENQLIDAESTVLELGCGLGLPAILAGKLGAKSVCLTDYLPDALQFAAYNWQLNLPEKQADYLQLDWREIPEDVPPVSLLLASDVAYEARAFEHLIPAFHRLCRPDGRILVTEPNRFVSKNFFENLANQGFNVIQTQQIIPFRGHDFTINIFDLGVK